MSPVSFSLIAFIVFIAGMSSAHLMEVAIGGRRAKQARR